MPGCVARFVLAKARRYREKCLLRASTEPSGKSIEPTRDYPDVASNPHWTQYRCLGDQAYLSQPLQTNLEREVNQDPDFNGLYVTPPIPLRTQKSSKENDC
jgi:hypothetical protein